MPFILSRKIDAQTPPLWKEGAPYERTSIYDGCAPDARSDVPPVHYDAHTLRPHSLAHADAPAHIIHGGRTIDTFFETKGPSPFWGPAVVVRFPQSIFEGQVLRVTQAQLAAAVAAVTGERRPPNRILITADAPQNWAMVLAQDAADWLTTNLDFVMYGTSWKSTDFMPVSRERPIHRTILRQAVIFECLELTQVPAGQYFWVGPPLPLVGASESPACPLLFRPDELSWPE